MWKHCIEIILPGEGISIILRGVVDIEGYNMLIIHFKNSYWLKSPAAQ